MQEVTLTPNRRLAATLQQHYNEQQMAAGASCWPTAKILPLSSWLQELWRQFSLQVVDAPLLLSSEQEQYLWEKTLQDAKDSAQLLQVHATAELVRSAYQLLKQWCVDPGQSAFQSADDYAALAKWIKEYRKSCAQQNWIDSASIPDTLLNKITLPAIIQLHGFTELTPQMQRFFSQVQVQQESYTVVRARSGRITLEDVEQEWYTMARWAGARHEEDSDARIACVIPELANQRDRIAQIFAEVFGGEDGYNISAGKALVQYPVINTALQLLKLARNETQASIFSYLLTSPFVGDAEKERDKRAAYDVYLRKENISYIHLSRLMTTSLSQYCPRLSNRLQAFYNHLQHSPRRQTYQAWARDFNEALSLLGWPGERSLSSVEYQVVSHWLELLQRFASLDIVAGNVDINEALAQLQRMAAKDTFQPQSPAANVQVLGLLEAAGSPFDEIWLSGMNDVAWPPSPSPNPFIPKAIQRELNMPHATAEREYLFCTALLAQFKNCSRQLIFSHAQHIEELEYKVSPMIHVEHEYSLSDIVISDFISPESQVFLSKNLTLFQDELAPPVTEQKSIGGISILTHQAACPFRAFAQWRLYAQELESPLPGLRAKDRGNAIHKALEIIWAKLRDQATLKRYSEPELDDLISAAVDTAMLEFPPSHIDLQEYLRLEKQRLQKILREWLEVEKTRPSFKVVSQETKLEYQLQGLTIAIRVDRIDELDDGKKLIIDYKTGTPDVHSWFEQRPEEPQLPLYALTQPDETIGICFAQITPGKHAFKGVSQYELNIKGIIDVARHKKAAATWEEQLAAWHGTLTRLAEDFSSGKAQVDPKDETQSCVYCALAPLCRKYEEIYTS